MRFSSFLAKQLNADSIIAVKFKCPAERCCSKKEQFYNGNAFFSAKIKAFCWFDKVKNRIFAWSLLVNAE